MKILQNIFRKRKVTIPEEIYDDLREQLENWADDAEEGTRRKSFGSSDGRITVRVDAELHKDCRKCEFRDDAWGIVKTCTEYNTRYRVSIKDYSVKNRNCNKVESDFEPELVEMEDDSVAWK